MASSVSVVNPRADVLSRSAALFVNNFAASGLVDILKTNLGPRGSLKMLVGGAGQVKITKDGNVLLNEMQIRHPTASLIARVCSAQDSITGDGTTSTALLIGELIKQSERYLMSRDIHPRVLCRGIEKAQQELLRFIDEIQIKVQSSKARTPYTASNISLENTGNSNERGHTVSSIGSDNSENFQRSDNTNSNEVSCLEGIDFSKEKCNKVADNCGTCSSSQSASKLETIKMDRELLESVARTSLRTKVEQKLADKLARIVVDSIQCIGSSSSPSPSNTCAVNNDTSINYPIADNSCTVGNKSTAASVDLFMVEILHMKKNLGIDTRFIRGMVMDHGARHPDMPKRLKNCFVLTCNVSLEYEKTEINSGFFYSSPEQRKRLVEAERQSTDEKVQKIIELKRNVCTPENKMNFAVFNQKGIDPLSLDMMAKEGIFALRRVKRRNMERLALCCGGSALNCVYNMKKEDLGFAGEIYEESLGDEKWTFVEQVKHPKSCAILVQGPNDHTITQIKDAIRDGLRAVKNVLEDCALIPGAGAFEVAAYVHLQEFARNELTGKSKYGCIALADSLLIIPTTLCANSGLDGEECILSLIEDYEKTRKMSGVDIYTGKSISPCIEGIWDNYCVKRQMITLAIGFAQQLLLVDTVIKGGQRIGNSANKT